MALTDTAIRALKPGPKDYKAADEKGLYLLVTPTGGKLWRLKYRSPGGVERKLSFKLRGSCNNPQTQLRGYCNCHRNPNTSQITDYHRDIFNAHGLPGSTFGGTAIGGSASLTNAITGWAGCRF